MQAVSSLALGARPELASSRAASQNACRPRARNVVMAADHSDKQLSQAAAAAAAAAMLLTSAQPALALGPTLYESDQKNVQELQDIIAARGKALPDISVPDVPEAVKAAVEAVKDKPLQKVAVVGKEKLDQVSELVPEPLARTEPAPAPPAPALSRPAPATPKAAVQTAKQAAPPAPSLPSTPAAPAEAPSQTTILGALAVVVAAGAAFAAAGKQGELPSDVQAGASQAADAVKGAASKASSSAEDAQKTAESNAAEAKEWIAAWRNGGKDKAALPGADAAALGADEAAQAAELSADEARQWIAAWREKQK